MKETIDQANICKMTEFLYDLRQITHNACIITAATPSAARELMVSMRKHVMREKWRVVPAVPNSPDVKHVVMGVDAILGKLKTKKVVKNWHTAYGMERGVFKVYTTVRYENAPLVRLNLKAVIYKNKDSKGVVMTNVAANMKDVATDMMLKDCIDEIAAGRASGNQGGADLGARGRLHEPLQLDTSNMGASPPPATPKESTPITSPPMEDVIENTNFPPLPFAGNMGSPGLGLMKVAKTGEKTKPEVGHHHTILSEASGTEEEMDGIEMEKQAGKDNVVQLLKDGNKRGAEQLDKSIDKGETSGAEERKSSAAKKNKSTGPKLQTILSKL